MSSAPLQAPTVAAVKAPIGFAARKATNATEDERKKIVEMMPDALKKSDAFRTILFLPDAWSTAGLKVASRFLRIWLHGSTGKKHGFVSIHDVTKKKLVSDYVLIDLQAEELRSMPEFSQHRESAAGQAISRLEEAVKAQNSPFVRKVSEAALSKSVAEGLKKQQPVVLGSFAAPTSPAGSDFCFHSFAYGDFIKTFVAPINRNLEERSTDFDCAFNEFTIMAYAKCQVTQAGDKALSLRFHQLGYRAVDSYDFVGTQPLGRWKVPDESRFILLWNSDFREFRDEFMPMYNRIAHERRMMVASLVCGDFKVVSSFVEAAIPGKNQPVMPVTLK